MRTASLVALVLMVAGIAILMKTDSLFPRQPVLIAVQIGAVILMIAARLTFGMRSFHAAANPTEGGVVSSGPYAVLRHPIYAAVIYFIWAAALGHPGAVNYGAAALTTAGAIMRMFLEEQMLVVRYPEYRAYMQRTKRVIPYVV